MTTRHSPTDFEAANAALIELEARFTHWRQNKSFSRESVPLELLESAQALTQYIGVKAVRAKLGITDSQLKRVQHHEATPDFVQVIAEPETVKGEDTRIDVHFANGMKVSIDGLKHCPKQLVSELLEGIHDRAQS